MTEAEHHEVVRHWLSYAMSDLSLAERLSNDSGGAPWQACFHAQQAVDKAIKAILVLLQIEFKKSHDLASLAALVPPDWAIAEKLAEVAELTPWAVEARYPGDWPDATDRDAMEAVAKAKLILEGILADFGRHGVAVNK
ncbi:MAG: HEPN domain-containing protein [Candidatus Sericytochromatia bacterium]|nr:HEPN domain-containing protein [Candidatus Tanganyikabacteria bacterium]